MPSAPRPKGKASIIAYNILGVGEKPKRKIKKKPIKGLGDLEDSFLPKMQ